MLAFAVRIGVDIAIHSIGVPVDVTANQLEIILALEVQPGIANRIGQRLLRKVIRQVTQVVLLVVQRLPREVTVRIGLAVGFAAVLQRGTANRILYAVVKIDRQGIIEDLHAGIPVVGGQSDAAVQPPTSPVPGHR